MKYGDLKNIIFMLKSIFIHVLCLITIETTTESTTTTPEGTTVTTVTTGTTGVQTETPEGSTTSGRIIRQTTAM
jgi:hypothetical protein